MPEGPEVQTIVTSLNETLQNHRVQNIEFVSGAAEKMIAPLSLQQFRDAVLDQTIARVSRRGKYIDVELTSGHHLIIHLLMTGQLILQDAWQKEERPRFLRCVFELDNQISLCIADKSTWVKIMLLTTDQTRKYNGFIDLGVDMFSEDFTITRFKQILSCDKKVHSLLLDQKIISGLGNIYANECLFHAGIHPTRKASSLSEGEITALYYSIRHVTKEALKQHGTTFSDYRTPDGKTGQYQKFLKVFKRAGKTCQRCGALVQRAKLSGRGIFYCLNEQPILNADYQTKSNQKSQLSLSFNSESVSKPPSSNFIFVIVGPSSVGKTTLSRLLNMNVPFLEIVPTVKTRPPRPGEQTGKDSIFVSLDEFESIKRNGGFVIDGEFYGNKYGTPKAVIEKHLAEGKDICLVLSLEGAQEIKAIYPNTYIIGLQPPNIQELKNRAVSREDYSASERADRIAALDNETIDSLQVDYIITAFSEEQSLQEAFDIIYNVRCATEDIQSE